MVGFGDSPTIVIGGVKVNAQENTSQLAIGDNFFQALDSQVKTNLITGPVFGDLNVVNQQPIASSVYDPDGADTTMPMVMSPLGLED